MPAVVDSEKCTGCESCVDSCPVEAIEMKDDLAVIDADTCSDCGACIDACPVEAITLE
ncbi:MAG: 4Fe-4S binding protein [Pirellulales bacterium]|nr:4Fe-4S binding protein [Pirellulales bacterium]